MLIGFRIDINPSNTKPYFVPPTTKGGASQAPPHLTSFQMEFFTIFLYHWIPYAISYTVVLFSYLYFYCITSKPRINPAGEHFFFEMLYLIDFF